MYREQTGGVEIEKPERMARWMRNSPADLIVDTMMADSRRHLRILRPDKGDSAAGLLEAISWGGYSGVSPGFPAVDP